MLRKIYELQRAAYGPNDPRCHSTLQKIVTIRGQEKADGRQSPPANPRHQRGNEESKTQLSNDEKRASNAQAEEGKSLGRCTPVPNGNGGGNGGGGKVNSVFKALRSLGRKKTT